MRIRSCLVLLAGLFAAALLMTDFHFVGAFWDTRTYADAMHRWSIGADPYHQRGNLFVYPPIFLIVANLIRNAMPGWLRWPAYAVCYISAFCLTAIVMVRGVARQRWMGIALGTSLLIAAPDLIGVGALLSGNISLLCYALAIPLALWGLRTTRWAYFYVAIFLVAQIKITFLILLMIPPLTSSGQYRKCLVCAASVLTSYWAQREAMPSLFGHFVEALNRQTYAGSIEDDGLSLFHFARRLNEHFHGPGYAPVLAQLMFTAGVFGCLLVLKSRKHLAAENTWLCLVFLAAILCNPRMKEYDLIIAVLPAYALLATATSQFQSLATILVILIPSPLLLVVHPMIAVTLLWIAAFCGGYMHLWHSKGVNEAGRSPEQILPAFRT